MLCWRLSQWSSIAAKKSSILQGSLTLHLFLLLPTGAMACLIIQDGPVEDKVVLVALAEEQVLEKPAQVGVVWPVLEPQTPAVVEVCHELAREVLAQDLYRGRHLLLHDLLILLLLRVGFQALPGQAPANEVHENVADCLQIIAPALLDSKVCVDTGIARSPC